tara:strand:+ start:200 stop:670 length:471 start_codon:yes stop_codon:yes gene_type:complete
MSDIEQQNIMLYSPRQMEIATFLGGPLCGIYMLSANYKRLEKTEYARNVIFIGSILTVLYMLGALHPLIDNFPQGVYQAIPVLMVWGICKKYHISREGIIEEERYTFRSNWTVFIVSIIGMAFIVILMFAMSFFVYEILGLSFGEEFLLDPKSDTS